MVKNASCFRIAACSISSLAKVSKSAFCCWVSFLEDLVIPGVLVCNVVALIVVVIVGNSVVVVVVVLVWVVVVVGTVVVGIKVLGAGTLTLFLVVLARLKSLPLFLISTFGRFVIDSGVGVVVKNRGNIVLEKKVVKKLGKKVVDG